MADAVNVRIEANGYRNAIIRVTDLSDGTGLAAFKIYDATASGAFGVNRAGQTFFPGIHTTIVGLDYDVQGMSMRMQWEATANEDIMVLGNAPQDFDFSRFGGIRVPAGLVGATGSILLTTVGAAANSSFWCNLYLRKNVPVS